MFEWWSWASFGIGVGVGIVVLTFIAIFGSSVPPKRGDELPKDWGATP